MVCGPGQCEWQEQAAGRGQNWELQFHPDPQLVEVGPCTSARPGPDTSCRPGVEERTACCAAELCQMHDPAYACTVLHACTLFPPQECHCSAQWMEALL